MSKTITYRLLKVSPEKIRPGDFYMSAEVNGHPHGLTGEVQRVDSVEPGDATAYRVVLKGGESIYVFDTETVLVEREYRR